MPGTFSIREHESFRANDRLSRRDLKDLTAFARSNQKDRQGNYRPVLQFDRSGGLRAGNYVGIITTNRRNIVEILPKIDLADKADLDHKETRRIFLNMLRSSRRLRSAAQFRDSAIRAMRRFPMLEVFVRLFLDNLGLLVRGGLSRRYVRIEENLPYLRGRILFRNQVRENLINQARFFVQHDELSVNRPANRPIQSTFSKLDPVVRNEENRQLLRNLEAALIEVPPARDLRGDWRKHRVDRSMQHYTPVMQWVGLFLFNRGLTTWSGRHVNQSLLFPMEEIYEDFVTQSFRRHKDGFTVISQGPRETFGETDGKSPFRMRPDIALRTGVGEVKFILDAKWKHFSAGPDASKHAPDQGDLYQLYAYARRYGCKTVALVYPWSRHFKTRLTFRFFDRLKLICLPFDVASRRRCARWNADGRSERLCDSLRWRLRNGEIGRSLVSLLPTGIVVERGECYAGIAIP